jgi:sensor histidine kinase YesM
MTHTDPILSRKLTRLQVGIWVIFYIFLLLYTLQKWENPRYGFWAASIATVFYFIAVYVNSSWLIPKFYKKGKPWLYVMLSVLVLIVLMTARMFVEFKILLPLHLKFYSWHLSHFAFVFITNFLAFAFGALLRVSIDYLSLLKQQEELKTRQLSAELNLLKSQVQPHFLFNTLNNIYYLAYTKNERTPEVIAKLSDIMRYFVDEAPKERVPLSTEIEFLKNYIELEQIRMLHPVKLEFSVNADESLPIPPMLLIPLVENIFKHGVDKTIETNEVRISVEQNNGYLVFVSENRISNGEVHRQSGMGLKNLRKRLALLYGNRFELSNRRINDIFRASLKFTV